MVGQRYYSPELCRFIQPADVSSLTPSSINGLNLYAYANNNPIRIIASNCYNFNTANNYLPLYTTAAALIDGIIPGLGTVLLITIYGS